MVLEGEQMVPTHGYKIFNQDMTNRYGTPFEEGIIYRINLKPIFGINGCGFHFCKRLEDTLRYYPAMEEEVVLAEVTSLGDLAEREDEYYGYYDMYSTNALRVDHVLKREEIIKMYLENPQDMPEDRVIRFLQGFRLTEEEIARFRLAYFENEKIQNVISYYQEGKTDIYEKVYQKRRLIERKK